MLIATVDNAKRIIHFRFSRFGFNAVILDNKVTFNMNVFRNFLIFLFTLLNGVAHLSNKIICQIKAQCFPNIFDSGYAIIYFKDIEYT